MPLSPDAKRKLIGCLGMLGSDHDGERAAAGLLATKIIKDAGMTWEQLLNEPAPKPKPDPNPEPKEASKRWPREYWFDIATQCSTMRVYLNSWECSFLDNILTFKTLSEKQMDSLSRIVEKLETKGY